MTLIPPKLDDRDFRSLVEEARARIPTFTPEWTNFNDSDPGMTLVQLHAWLTETLLYRVNKLPDLAYVNFLNLLGTRAEPARAATAELTFTFADLDGANDPLSLLVPKGAQVGVKDPDLPAPLTFETDATLRGINARVAAIIVPDGTARRLVGEYDADEGALALTQPFRPFGDAAGGETMLVAILLRPFRKKDVSYFLDRFPQGELDLLALTPQVFEQNASGATIAGPFGSECLFPWQVAEAGSDVEWSAYTGNAPLTDFDTDLAWTPLKLRGDETAGLDRSGHIFLDCPPNVSPVAFRGLARAVWESFDLSKPPSTIAELIADIEDGVFVPADLPLAVWRDQLGLANPPLTDQTALIAAITAAGNLNFAAVDEAAWTDLGYSAAPAPHDLHWFRARLAFARDRAPEVSGLHLNSTRATAALTRQSEVLGSSAGRPNQTFRLRQKPVLIDPATDQPVLTLQVIEPAGTIVWQPGPDFFGAAADASRYVLDPIEGVVTFGDGVNGRIPVAGARIVATLYRVGGGAVGNVAAGTISSLKTALPQVKSVANLRRAAGGSDAETLDAVKLRAPELLRTRDRAVTAQDFADLALRTSGVALKSAFALPLTRLDLAHNPPGFVDNSPGAVTVVVLPINNEETPQPSEDQLRLICAHLNERRLITTELYVTGPRYVAITTLAAEIRAAEDADLKAVHDACLAALRAYFHPLTGGEDGAGWPFGGDIFRGAVFGVLQGQAGVSRVADLKIALAGGTPDPCLDLLPVPPGTLPHLPLSTIALDVRYARDG